MELTCLNCAGTFVIDESMLDPNGGIVQCPVCGRAQRLVRRVVATSASDFARQPGSSLAARRDQTEENPAVPSMPDEAPAASAPRSPPGDAPSNFRRPMQAFSNLRGRPAAAGVELTPPVAPPPNVDLGARLTAAGHGPSQSMEAADLTPPEARIPAGLSAAVAQVGDTPQKWLVKSPTGLVLEFPSSHLLVNWSSVVDNPAPYLVSRGGEEWTAMDAWLSEVRHGSRATQVFRRMTGKPELPESPGAGGTDPAMRIQRATAESRKVAIGDRRVPATAHFQFKIAEPKKPTWHKWAIVGGAVFVGLGIAVAALFVTGVI